MLALVLAVVAAFHPGVPQPGGITALHGIKWKLHTGGPVVASPTLAGNRVYVGSYDGNLYALDAASGAVAWKVDLGARVASSAAVSDGLVYVLGYDAQLHALDSVTGKSNWTFATKGEHRFTATHLHGALPVAEAMPDPFDVFLSSPTVVAKSGLLRNCLQECADSMVRHLDLAFARVVLQAPPWILIDDTLRSLDGDTLERFMDTLAHELLHTGVIHIGGGQARNPLFTRTLHLTKAPPSHTVGRDDAAAVVPPIPNPASRPGP